MALRPALAAVLLSVLLPAPAPAAEVTIGGRTLTVADGFEVELVAGPPLVERPISAAFDDLGRLYVTDSAGMSDKADVQAKAKPHRVRRLEDTDGDGRFEKSVVFASGIGFPEGCLWHGGSVYVAAPPQILKLTDADGDGVAEKREVWFDGKTVTGCGNDLHGPYLGRDGWLYWCKGAFAEQTYTLPSGKPFTTRASHVFRARPDGTGIEPVLTGGMDNPVGLAFLSTGERVLSCTFLQHPANGRRDGLLHAVYGGVYGKVHDVLDGHAMTGSEMPVLSHQGAAAPAGLIAGSDALFGGGYQDRLLACYFNLHKVTLHELAPNGSTFVATDTDLLSCDHPDFHPTDVIEDDDGSVLIVDTGGWYKICCPTSVLAKPDVLGAIYRVRRKGQPKVEDPRGLKLKWDGVEPAELVRLLTDPRPAVRRRAVAAIRAAGPAGARALAT
ncbi:MAG TPA: PVC-type heme-binding CxxCH protein, partial [Humisphaera sp.]